MKFPVIAAALALIFSSAASAEDASSHTVHHPSQTQAADQGTTQAPAPIAKPADQTPAGTNTNCPMMGDGQANMMNMMGSQPPTNTPQQHMSGGGRMVPMPNTPSGTAQTATNCPMMQQQHPVHTMTLHHDTTP